MCIRDSETPDDPKIDAGLVKLVSVGDYVWYDVNRDGIQGEGEAPVPGVTVNLYDDETGELLATAVTDENGFYSFTDLWAGATYTIEFVKPAGTSFTSMGAGEDDTVDSNADVVSGTYTFQAAAENESARVNSGVFTVRYDPNFVPPGTQQYNTLTFAPAVSTSGGWTTLRTGTAITITWPDAPGGAARVDFTLTPTGGASRIIGSDANPLDGTAITWTVPAGTSGQIQGRATMPNGQVITSEAAGVIAQ